MLKSQDLSEIPEERQSDDNHTRISHKFLTLSTMNCLQKTIHKNWSNYSRIENNRILIFDKPHAHCENISRDIGKKLSVHRWTNIRNITFDLETSKVDDQDFKNLVARIRKNLAFVRYFKMDLNHPTPKLLRSVATEVVPHLIRCKSFTLNLRDCSKIHDQELELLFISISTHLMDLKDFEIRIANGCYLTNGILNKFGSRVCSYLSRLKDLRLNVFNCGKLGDEAVEQLMSKIGSRLRKVDTLKLLLANCSNIKAVPFGDVLSVNKKYFRNLKKLSLDLSNCSHVTTDSLVIFGLNSTMLSHLKRFKLDLSNCSEITDRSVGILLDCLTPGITTLALILDNCKRITDRSLKAIASKITKDFVHLKKLKLNLNKCDIGRDSILELGVALLNRSSLLTYLDLSFNNCQKITDQSFKTLGLCIGNSLLQLNYLALSFTPQTPSAETVKEEEIQDLISKITINLTNLDTLKFNFTKCTWITDSILKVLTENITNQLSKLSDLTIGIEGCERITESGLSYFPSCLRNKKDFRRFELNIKHCKEIKLKFIAALIREHRFIPKFYIKHS